MNEYVISYIFESVQKILFNCKQHQNSKLKHCFGWPYTCSVFAKRAQHTSYFLLWPFGIPAQVMFLQHFDIISHESKLVRAKVKEIVPCVYSCFMQIIKEQPGQWTHSKHVDEDFTNRLSFTNRIRYSISLGS